MRRIWLLVIYGVVIIGIGYAIYWLSIQERANQPPQYWHIAAMIGSLIIAIGWIIGSENTVRNAQKQQAIAVCLAYERDPVTTAHRDMIRKYLPTTKTTLVPGGPIPSYDCAEHELYAAVDYELNSMDFIASGVLSETLDGDVIRKSFQTQFFYRYHQCKPYIDHVRKSNARIWKEYYDLCNDWEVWTYVVGPDGY